MADVRLQQNLKLPPVPAYQALQDVLAGIAGQQGAWRGFALHVRLGDLHLPDVGYVAVPIALTVGAVQAATHEIGVSFIAASQAGSFPTFTGAMGVDTTGPTGSILWLDGGYDVPLHVFGKLIDATFAAGVAKRTLENLLEDIAAAVLASVEKREAEYMRYHLYER